MKALLQGNRVLTFSLKRESIGKLYLNLHFFISKGVAQVLIHRWLFPQISHKMLAENPASGLGGWGW